MQDFESPEVLAAHLLTLNSDDEAYGRLLLHKTQGTVDNARLIQAAKDRPWSEDDETGHNFVEAFECRLCEEVGRKEEDLRQGYSPVRRAPADSRHFNCPPPVHPVTREVNPDNWWVGHWSHAEAEARAVHQLAARNRNYTAEEFHLRVIHYLTLPPAPPPPPT